MLNSTLSTDSLPTDEQGRTAIERHISNIFTEGELDENMVCANLHTPLSMAQ
jgi:hypothetical protein